MTPRSSADGVVCCLGPRALLSRVRGTLGLRCLPGFSWASLTPDPEPSKGPPLLGGGMQVQGNNEPTGSTQGSASTCSEWEACTFRPPVPAPGRADAGVVAADGTCRKCGSPGHGAWEVRGQVHHAPSHPAGDPVPALGVDAAAGTTGLLRPPTRASAGQSGRGALWRLWVASLSQHRVWAAPPSSSSAGVLCQGCCPASLPSVSRGARPANRPPWRGPHPGERSP